MKRHVIVPHMLRGGMALLLAAGAARADTPRDLRDMVGARAGQAEGELGRRGYAFVRTQTGADRKWAYWWNRDTRTCVTIATVNGRYDAVTTSPPADCGHSAGGGRGSGAQGGSVYPPPGYGRPDDRRPDYGHQDQGRGDDRGDARGYDRGGSLALICYGEGQKPGVDVRSGYEWNPSRHRYEPRSYIGNRPDRFDSEVQVELRGDRGRIHLTGKLVAPIHSGGVDGWWELRDLRVGPDRITGRYRLNGLNSPKVDIDRRSGRIRIDGIEHFRGECDVGDWSSGNRF